MKEIKQRKERRFLKTLGRVGEILVEQVLLKIGSNLIKKIGGKKTLPSILFLLLSFSLFAQYPTTGNKQRLGFQTTGDGLVYRGRAADTVGIKSSGLNNAYFILDTVNNIQYNYIKTKGGWQFSNGDTIIINNNFSQPVDSLFFNVGVPTNNVETAKMRWDSDLATVVLGLNDNVPNELGFKNFWLVKNQTGATIAKGSLVYANGTVGASGRITVAKFIANGSIDAKYLLGITAHDLSNEEDGYVISFGKIRKVNTDTFAAGAILYPSPTVSGVWTDVEPVAPNIDMPIGFCINSSINNGTIAIRVASGYKLNELHDVSISSPVEKSSLYYSGGLWRDTTAALLTSDTSSMLTTYLRTGVAAGTYLPLTGGTLSGNLNLSSGTLNTWTSAYSNAPRNEGSISKGYFYNLRNSSGGYGNVTRVIHNYMFSQDENSAAPQTFYYGRLNGFYAQNYNTESASIIYDASIYYHNNNQFYYRAFSEVENKVTFSIKPSTTLNSISGTKADLYLSGDAQIDRSLNIGTTLGVTGATTLSAPLTVNSSAVFNEGSTNSDFRIESDGNANMVFVDASTDRVGIGTNIPTKTLDVVGEIISSGEITANSFKKSGGTFNQFLKGDGTVDGNDYLTTSSAASIYYPKIGGTISGAVTLSTTTATPTSLLGKDGSNVVGTVTDINQSGIMKVGGTTATTDAVGNINVAHGLSYTPSKVIATIAQLNSYVIVIRGITPTNLEFTVYDSTTGAGLNTLSVGFFWIAFK